jgi:hypothetical protein
MPIRPYEFEKIHGELPPSRPAAFHRSQADRYAARDPVPFIMSSNARSMAFSASSTAADRRHPGQEATMSAMTAFMMFPAASLRASRSESVSLILNDIFYLIVYFIFFFVSKSQEWIYSKSKQSVMMFRAFFLKHDIQSFQ